MINSRFRIVWILSGLLLLLSGGAYATGTPTSQQFIAEPSGMSNLQAPPDNLNVVSSKNIDINYQTPPGSHNYIANIELWYACGSNGPWRFYGYDKDRVPPIQFIAPSEGVYRFLVVAVDKWGRRSGGNSSTGARPDFIPADVPAQQTVFIDYTRPRLYLHNTRETISQHDKNIQIRWMGFDTYLPSRPVQLFWKANNNQSANPQDDTWFPLAPAQPSAGSFVWPLPKNLAGTVTIKAVLTDHVGNQDVQYTSLIVQNNNAPINARSSIDIPPKDTKITHLSTTDSDSAFFANNELISNSALQAGGIIPQPSQLIDHSDSAVKTLQQSIDAQPNSSKTRLELAKALYKTGKFQQAQQQYLFCLNDNPSDKNALLGLAQTRVALNQFDKAGESMKKLFLNDKKTSGDIFSR